MLIVIECVSLNGFCGTWTVWQGGPSEDNAKARLQFSSSAPWQQELET